LLAGRHHRKKEAEGHQNRRAGRARPRDQNLVSGSESNPVDKQLTRDKINLASFLKNAAPADREHNLPRYRPMKKAVARRYSAART
jgi:hypothetical protein